MQGFASFQRPGVGGEEEEKEEGQARRTESTHVRPAATLRAVWERDHAASAVDRPPGMFVASCCYHCCFHVGIYLCSEALT